VKGGYLPFSVSPEFLCVLRALCVKAFSGLTEEARSCVGERFVKAGGWLRQLAGLEDRSAVQTFHIFRVGILGDELRARMAAGSRVVHKITPKLSES
jgi:hypothetical protein